jgi:hypothetical protein
MVNLSGLMEDREGLARGRVRVVGEPMTAWTNFASGTKTANIEYRHTFLQEGLVQIVVEAEDNGTPSKSIARMISTTVVSSQGGDVQRPIASLTGPRTLNQGESQLFGSSAYSAKGLKRWRVFLATNLNPRWTNVTEQRVSIEFAYTFQMIGPQLWVVEAEDIDGFVTRSEMPVVVMAPVPVEQMRPTAKVEGPQVVRVGASERYMAEAQSSKGLKRWRVYLSTNANPRWTDLPDQRKSASVGFTHAFSATGPLKWFVEVEDVDGVVTKVELQVNISAQESPYLTTAAN